MDENVGMPLCDIRALQAERDEYIRQYKALFKTSTEIENVLLLAEALLKQTLKGSFIDMPSFRENVQILLDKIKELRDVKDCSSN